MHKVRMIKTTPGVNDGDVIPTTYFEGKEYSIGQSLLEAFIDLGVVELAKSEDPHETKVTAPAETKPAAKRAKK